MTNLHRTETAWLPDLLYTSGRFERGLALVADAAGRITHVTRDYESLAPRAVIVRLAGRALLPGLVNAHSHAFQRVIRGRTERRSGAHDSFWTWREMMYAAATRLAPADLYDASRMAFLEMAASGISAVGEFHYLHHAPGGTRYADANELAKQVVRAARDVGLRIALLNVAYARAGWNQSPDARQARFIESDAQEFLKQTDALAPDLARDALNDTLSDTLSDTSQTDAGKPKGTALQPDNETHHDIASAWVGVAPHSVRAVPLDYLREVCAFAAARRMPLHMHVAEQPAEVAACLAEHAETPVALLAREGLLDERFTGIHAVHITEAEAHALAAARAHVCACPTTERNLGDGIVPADLLFREGARISLGSDSHTQIDLLEDARELEYHLRLQKLQRAVLAPDDAATPAAPLPNIPARPATPNPRAARESGLETEHDAGDSSDGLGALAARLFDCATLNGATSIGANGGTLEAGRPADFFTVDLNDPSIAGAGADDLLPLIVFSLARTAVRDVFVGGRRIVENGAHAAQGEIVERFAALQRKLWK